MNEYTNMVRRSVASTWKSICGQHEYIHSALSHMIIYMKLRFQFLLNALRGETRARLHINEPNAHAFIWVSARPHPRPRLTSDLTERPASVSEYKKQSTKIVNLIVNTLQKRHRNKWTKRIYVYTYMNMENLKLQLYEPRTLLLSLPQPMTTTINIRSKEIETKKNIHWLRQTQQKKTSTHQNRTSCSRNNI